MATDNFKTGQTFSRMIADDIRREILVLDNSMIEHGYFTAKVKSFNVRHTSGNALDQPDFGDPVVIHAATAWTYETDESGVVRSEIGIPLIQPTELEGSILQLYPQLSTRLSTINPLHKSWSLEVSGSVPCAEFVWGPLSGFGGIDRHHLGETIDLGYCDKYLYSEVDAFLFLDSCLENV